MEAERPLSGVSLGLHNEAPTSAKSAHRQLPPIRDLKGYASRAERSEYLIIRYFKVS